MTARRIGELLVASTTIPAIAPPDEAVCACVSIVKPQNSTKDTRNTESYMRSTPHKSIVAPLRGYNHSVPLRRRDHRESSSTGGRKKRRTHTLWSYDHRFAARSENYACYRHSR